jgi:hypothetical protein
MEAINQYTNFIVAGLVVLVVLIAVLLVWRAMSQKVRGRRGQRLGISEYHELDQTRRLVLVRRDNVEHLLVIGGTQDLLVESGIAVAGHPDHAPASELGGDGLAASVRPVPRPAIFGERKAPPLRPVERSEPPLAGSRVRDPDQP